MNRSSSFCGRLLLVLAIASGFAAFSQTPPIQVNINTAGFGLGFGCCEAIVGDANIVSFNPFPSARSLHIAGGDYSDGGDTGGWTFTYILSNGDMLVFNDPSSSLQGNTGVGTATLTFGTGAFLLAKGKLNYTVTCDQRCDTNNNALVAENFDFTVKGTGLLFVQPGTALPSTPNPPSGPQATVQVNPLPPATVDDSTMGWFLIWLRNTFNIQSQPGPAPDIVASSGSMQITPYWQPFPVSYQVTSKCANLPGPCWLSIANPTGNIPAFSTNPINAVLNFPPLGNGTYPADVIVTLTPSDPTLAPSTIDVPLTLIVTPDAPRMTLSTTGMQFQAVQGAASGAVSQTLSVTNAGSGSMAYQAVASTLSGGNWLSVLPASGSITNTPASVKISANPGGLAAGTYFGRVEFSSSGAVGSPESVVVALTVAPIPSLTTNGTPIVTPAGLVFVAGPGPAPASQTVQLTSASTKTLTVNPQAQYIEQPSAKWLTVKASSPTLAAGRPMTQTVSVNPAGLAPGVYLATLAENVMETTSTYPVNVALVVAAAGCTPKQLVAVLTSIGNHFQSPAGLPVTLQAQILNDCGAAVNSGSVTAAFASDPPTALTSTGSGTWQGTWLPHGTGGGAAGVTLNAAASTPSLQGSQNVTGTLTANPSMVAISATGVVNAASLATRPAFGPGSFISIFGSNLSASTSSGAVPLPVSLGGTRVLLNGQPLPLVYAGSNQVNAVIPYDTPINSSAQVIVQSGSVISMAEQITLGPAQPANFSQNGSGSGAGVVIVVKPDGRQFLATPGTPATAGDALVIYCTGLGAVDMKIAAGAAAPSSPPVNTVNPASVTIGGLSAQVLFSGLSPGFFGLYQVNAVVPAGVATGPSVPLNIAMNGISSPAVTLAIQ